MPKEASQLATDAQILRLLNEAQNLVSIVEGIHSPSDHWRSTSEANMRLKDSPVWCAFYVALQNATRQVS